jgi:hypothetical protein
MKGMFLKKALMLSLAIGLSTPMLAVDGQSRFEQASTWARSLFSPKTVEVAPVVVAPVAPTVVVKPGYMQVARDGIFSGYTYAKDGIVSGFTYAKDGVVSGSKSLYANATDNRVVNPLVTLVKNNPRVSAAVGVAAVAGLGYGIYKYKTRTKKSEVASVTEGKPGYLASAYNYVSSSRANPKNWALFGSKVASTAKSAEEVAKEAKFAQEKIDAELAAKLAQEQTNAAAKLAQEQADAARKEAARIETHEAALKAARRNNR